MHAPLTINTLEFIDTQEWYAITGIRNDCRCTTRVLLIYVPVLNYDMQYDISLVPVL